VAIAVGSVLIALSREDELAARAIAAEGETGTFSGEMSWGAHAELTAVAERERIGGIATLGAGVVLVVIGVARYAAVEGERAMRAAAWLDGSGGGGATIAGRF
jgi:hypothetical protein